MAARKRKIEEAMKEDLGVADVNQAEDLKKTERVILKHDTPLRRFPTLQKEHIVMTGRAGTGYGIQHAIGGAYGWFYKLDNGYYIVKDGDYTII